MGRLKELIAASSDGACANQTGSGYQNEGVDWLNYDTVVFLSFGGGIADKQMKRV